MSPSRPLATVFLLALCGTAFAAGSFTLESAEIRGSPICMAARRISPSVMAGATIRAL